MILRLLLGLVDAGEPVEEALLGVDVDERDAELVANASTTCSASFLRIRPWSTSTQVSWSPTARWTSSAATAESTPPERPQITRPVADLGADPLDLLVDHRRGRPLLARSRRRRAGSGSRISVP